MRDDFCAIILTHGRPDRVTTYHSLRKAGYTGPIYLLVDDLDPTVEQYRETFGEQVLIFDKRAAAAKTDDGITSRDLRAVVYARNSAHAVVAELGYRYFLVLDDDYREWKYTWRDGEGFSRKNIRGGMDELINAVLRYMERAPFTSIAFAQGGDFIGGSSNNFCTSLRRRKVMNTFFCSVDRPFKFLGKINEDTTTYVVLAQQGHLFLTLGEVQVNQGQTQAHSGGLTDIYQAMGTYIKSFFSVMYSPSCVSIATMGGGNGGRYTRIHHSISWRNAVPQIVREQHKKGTGRTS